MRRDDLLAEQKAINRVAIHLENLEKSGSGI